MGRTTPPMPQNVYGLFYFCFIAPKSFGQANQAIETGHEKMQEDIRNRNQSDSEALFREEAEESSEIRSVQKGYFHARCFEVRKGSII